VIRPAVAPPPLGPSKFAYGRKAPAMRAAELPEICSVQVQDLFPELADPIHRHGDDLAPIRDAARSALAHVDMSMIGTGDSVNILCSEHGFAVMGGQAYAELIKTVRDEVTERTGAGRIKLALSSAVSKFEQNEIIPRYGLDDHFEGKTFTFGPYDPGVAIDTEIGRLYGIRTAYAAKRLIHVHYDDPREVHYHHLNGRLLKSFTMSYARMETRSIFHTNFPTRSANIVPRAIYESKYIRDRWAFAAVLCTSPTGTMGIDADNDLIALDRRASRAALRRYGKMLELFNTIDSCFVIADDTRWLPYQHAGGLTACALYENGSDHLDLDFPAHPPARFDKSPIKSPARAVVVNYAWKLLFAAADLMIGADADVGRDLLRIHGDANVVVASNLAEAVRIAAEQSGTDKGIVFDGSYGSINLTRPMAEHLLAKAPEVSRLVDSELMPKWLAQRHLPLSA
jgi:hypothetical protein